MHRLRATQHTAPDHYQVADKDTYAPVLRMERKFHYDRDDTWTRYIFVQESQSHCSISIFHPKPTKFHSILKKRGHRDKNHLPGTL